ncbi:MAG: hypothetical protein ACKVH8_09920 [Pirellulales bacterium]
MDWFTFFLRTRHQMISELAASIAVASVPFVHAKISHGKKSMGEFELRGYIRARAASTIYNHIEALTGYDLKIASQNKELLIRETMNKLQNSELLQPAAQVVSGYRYAKAA